MRLVPMLRYFAMQSQHCAFLSSTNAVRNMHILTLKNSMDPEVFEDKVLCIGTCDLNALSRSRTLPARTSRAMQRAVSGHEGLMEDLNSALQNFLVVVSIARMPGLAQTADLIDAYGDFTASLAASHAYFAFSRIQLEHLVSAERLSILQRCRVLVATLGGISKDANLKMVAKMLGSDGFRLVCYDEIGKTFHFDYCMLMATLEKWITPTTQFGWAGDPCQTALSREALDSMQQFAINYGTNASPLAFLFGSLQSSKLAPARIVGCIDLLNRTTDGKRCRRAQAAIVSRLNQFCLPGKIEWWNQIVDGKPLWANLEPRRSRTKFDVYLDARVPPVVGFDTMQGFEDKPAWLDLIGDVRKSRYDLGLAYASGMVAICLAVRMKVLYSEYDRGNWQLHFDTMEACEARINEEVHVHILTP